MMHLITTDFFVYGLVIGTLIGFAPVLFLILRWRRLLETMRKTYVDGIETMRQETQKEIEKLTFTYKSILLNVGYELDVNNVKAPSAKGLLQIIEENKPVHLSVRDTLVELLKRCE